MVALMSLTQSVSDKSVCYYRDLRIQQCSTTLSLFVFAQQEELLKLMRSQILCYVMYLQMHGNATYLYNMCKLLKHYNQEIVVNKPTYSTMASVSTKLVSIRKTYYGATVLSS